MRDRDVRNAIHDALVATGAFDGVWIWGLPEHYGSGSSQLAAAAIEPESSSQDDRWDGGTETALVVTSLVIITLLYRHEDPQLRDEAAELLMDTAANALNGRSLAALTLPDLTRFLSWRWQNPTPPERRIAAVFSYQYIVEGWSAYDVTP
jgi:hypothetical protein